ncbi:MAG: WD40-repeat-containing domain protein [Piptocephalis tieghemiana]|nr:MAG: WD40-repeat-containing domain protein [Piptocephalis tieghemiana]
MPYNHSKARTTLSDTSKAACLNPPNQKQATAKSSKSSMPSDTDFQDSTSPKAPSSAPKYSPSDVKKLATAYPDSYWSHHPNSSPGMIGRIDLDRTLGLVPQAKISDTDGTLLVTFSHAGDARVWEVGGEWRLLQKLRDLTEENIDEFLVGQFSPSQAYLLIGGKLKDRRRWSADDDDNHILPCPLKIFDVLSGELITQLHGHKEEILCIKSLWYRGTPYWITTSQDGSIIKWRMEDDWITLVESTPMVDEETWMAFTVSFLPNTGNRYFMAAADDSLKLFDFETNQVVKVFQSPYTSYCDCAKFILPLDLPQPKGRKSFAYLAVRGVETIEDDVASQPNRCFLYRLTYPSGKDGEFTLGLVQTFQHELNGIYLAAPTMLGTVCIFRLSDGQLLHLLKDHEALFSNIDGKVCVYTYVPAQESHPEKENQEDHPTPSAGTRVRGNGVEEEEEEDITVDQ